MAASNATASAVWGQIEGDKSTKKKLKKYPIGYFHIDIAEVGTEQGQLYPFVVMDSGPVSSSASNSSKHFSNLYLTPSVTLWG